MLGPKGRERFRCRYVQGSFQIPSESIIRNVLIRVDPEQLDLALQQWHKAHGQEDESLAIAAILIMEFLVNQKVVNLTYW